LAGKLKGMNAIQEWDVWENLSINGGVCREMQGLPEIRRELKRSGKGALQQQKQWHWVGYIMVVPRI